MTYSKEKLENLLREYSKNEAKLTEVKLKKEECEEELKYASEVFIESKEDTIEGMQLTSATISETPISRTNKISDKTINTVINYPKELYKNKNKRDLATLENKIKKYTVEEEKLNKIVVRVKNLLQPLNEKQKFIIKEFYIHKSNWNQVSSEFKENFNELSIKQLQNIRDKALEIMLEIINS